MADGGARGKPDPRELQLLWQSKLVEAYKRYQQAADNFRKLSRDLDKSGMAQDATEAVRKALWDELAALHEYREASRVFAWVTLHGEEPPEE